MMILAIAVNASFFLPARAHEFEIKDLTEEAALVGISDGTDMTKGRGRLAFDKINVNIRTVNALSIEKVEITKRRK